MADASFPCPVFIFGDAYIAKNNLIAAKDNYSKHKDIKWVEMSLAEDSPNKIRMECGATQWGEEDFKKVILLTDLPNRKEIREFLLDLCSSVSESTKIIIWDSKNAIKIDPKTKELSKTWSDFIGAFKKVNGNKIINNGFELTGRNDEEDGSIVDFVRKNFEKMGKEIGFTESKVLVDIVGYNKGLLLSDIEKICLTCSSPVTIEFILDNAFPTSKEGILYKFNNALDDSCENAINLAERFMQSGINMNVLAEIIVKKARWRMLTSYYWSEGVKWNYIPDKLMEIGGVPSRIWHNPNITMAIKRQQSQNYQDEDGLTEYLIEKEGIPKKYFKKEKEVNVVKRTKKGKISKAKPKSKKNKNRSEMLPMRFMAVQIVNFIKNRMGRNKTKEEILDKGIKIYLFTQEKLAEVRYSGSEQALYEMIRALTKIY